MAQIHWTHIGNGNWTTATDWSSGTVPGATDDVFIGINGITVTSNSNETVDCIGTNTNATLKIGGDSTFTATNGSSNNLGTIDVLNGSNLEVSAGVFDNYGTIILGSTGAYTNFLVDTVVQIEGGGTIEMAPDNSPNLTDGILGDGKNPQLAQLDNVNCDIAGDGFVGYLFFDNQAGGILETNSTLGAGTLRLVNNNAPGEGFQNEGHVFADDGGTLELLGVASGPAFFNVGTFYINSVGDRTVFEIADDVTLKGGGNVTLSDNFYNYIESNGQAATLENVDNLISGSGQAYDANLTLINDAQGKIEADNANFPLILYTGNHTITNAGLLESVNGATLQIDSPVDNSGVIAASTGKVSILGNLSGSGKSEIFSGGQLDLGDSSNTAAVTFENNANDTGVLALAHGSGFNGTVAGFYNDGANSDVLDLQNIKFASGVSWSFQENAAGKRGVLTVDDGHGDIARIALLGQYLAAGGSATSATSNLFQTSSDHITNTTGTLVTTNFRG